MHHVRHTVRASACILLAVLAASDASAGGPEVGQPAPPLQLEKLIQAPDDARTDWESLRGKVVVLEFWATWCGPCVAAIPHLNEVAEAVKDQPVRFIAISNEKEEIVRNFLKRKKMSAWVALDQDRATFTAYGVRGIPHTVIVDAKGRIAAITYPTELTAEALKAVVEGRDPGLPTQRRTPRVRSGNREWSEPLYEISIRRARDPMLVSTTSSVNALKLEGATLARAFGVAWDVPNYLVDVPPLLYPRKIDVNVTLPHGSPKRLREALRTALVETFDVHVRREQRRQEVWVMRRLAGQSHRLTPSAVTAVGSSTIRAGGELSVSNLPLSKFALQLADILEEPICDETEIDGYFDIRLVWTSDSRESLVEAVRQQLGLDLVREQREVTWLVVEKEEPRRANK